MNGLSNIVVIVCYVLGIILQIGLLFLKPRYLSTIPLIITCSIALSLRSDDFFILSFIQAGIDAIGVAAFRLYDSRKAKKRGGFMMKRKLINIIVGSCLGIAALSTTIASVALYAIGKNKGDVLHFDFDSYENLNCYSGLEKEFEKKDLTRKRRFLANTWLISLNEDGKVSSLNGDRSYVDSKGNKDFRKRQLTQGNYQINKLKRDDTVNAIVGVNLFDFFGALPGLNLEKADTISVDDEWTTSINSGCYLYTNGVWKKTETSVSGYFTPIDLVDSDGVGKMTNYYIERSFLWIEK